MQSVGSIEPIDQLFSYSQYVPWNVLIGSFCVSHDWLLVILSLGPSIGSMKLVDNLYFYKIGKMHL
jgi:hypothetical protein